MPYDELEALKLRVAETATNLCDARKRLGIDPGAPAKVHLCKEKFEAAQDNLRGYVDRQRDHEEAEAALAQAAATGKRRDAHSAAHLHLAEIRALDKKIMKLARQLAEAYATRQERKSAIISIVQPHLPGQVVAEVAGQLRSNFHSDEILLSREISARGVHLPEIATAVAISAVKERNLAAWGQVRSEIVTRLIGPLGDDEG